MIQCNWLNYSAYDDPDENYWYCENRASPINYPCDCIGCMADTTKKEKGCLKCKMLNGNTCKKNGKKMMQFWASDESNISIRVHPIYDENAPCYESEEKPKEKSIGLDPLDFVKRILFYNQQVNRFDSYLAELLKKFDNDYYQVIAFVGSDAAINEVQSQLIDKMTDSNAKFTRTEGYPHIIITKDLITKEKCQMNHKSLFMMRKKQGEGN